MNDPREILVLEGNEKEVDLIEEILGKTQSYHQLCNPINLEAFFSENRVDLIIANEDTLGGDPLATIARMQVITDAPIILMSEKTSTDFKQQAFNCGIHGLVTFPIIRQELASVVAPLLSSLSKENQSDIKNNKAIRTILQQRNLNQSIYLHLNQLIDLLSTSPNGNTNTNQQAAETESRAEKDAQWLDACLLEIQTIYQNNRRLDNSFKCILDSVKADLAVVPSNLPSSPQQETSGSNASYT